MMWGRIIFSSNLAIGDKRDIGRYEGPMFGSLLGLGIGMIFASFQIWGMMLLFRERLYIVVRYWMAIGPRCFRCFMFILSGPVELLFLAALSAVIVCSGVMVMGVEERCLIFLMSFLLLVLVVCLIMFVNCFVN